MIMSAKTGRETPYEKTANIFPVSLNHRQCQTGIYAREVELQPDRQLQGQMYNDYYNEEINPEVGDLSKIKKPIRTCCLMPVFRKRSND
jgi:hypothetical protein